MEWFDIAIRTMKVFCKFGIHSRLISDNFSVVASGVKYIDSSLETTPEAQEAGFVGEISSTLETVGVGMFEVLSNFCNIGVVSSLGKGETSYKTSGSFKNASKVFPSGSGSSKSTDSNDASGSCLNVEM